MSPKKAQSASLLAFRKVLEAAPDSRLELIGGGRMLGFQRQLAQFLGVDDRVRFHGVLEHTAVLDLLASARCYLQPSVQAQNGDCEGTPVSVLEGMAVGLPVVATRHGGISDVVRDGCTGCLVEEYDVDALAKAMLLYAQDPELAGIHGKAGREEVAAKWSMEHSLGRLNDIIQEAAG
jgi:glycosyltransferase involved in cell wall biosynthesis